MAEIEIMDPTDGGAIRAPSKTLNLSLVAEQTAVVGNQRLDLKRRKLLALLGYLALSEGRTSSRERLVGLLWSETPEANARTSLRQVLHWLRRSCDESGYEGLFIDKLTVSLNEETLLVDVWQVIEAADNKKVHQKLLDVADFPGKLLSDLDDLDPAFRMWLMARRESLRERLSRSLEEILTDEAVSETERVRAAEAIVNLDPTHEESVRYLMWARASSGNIGGALRVYKILWDVLDEDYAMEPSAKTQELVARIKSGEFDTVSEGSPQARPVEPSPIATAAVVAPDAPRMVIAVEPFSLEGAHPGQHHLLMGFRHFLIGSFVRFREWRILDLQSSQLARSNPDVRFVVQASVLGKQDETNVVLTLKDTDTGFYVWSDRFTLGIDDLIMSQQRIVRSVTAALNVHLSIGRMLRPLESTAIPTHLYDTWLRGQALINRYDPGDWQAASNLFEEVIRRAPDFAPAYSSLVQLKNARHIVHPGVFRKRENQASALGLAWTAAKLDPVDSRTHLCLAWAYAFDEQFEPAEMHFDLARELNDLDPWTLLSVAQGLAFLGDDIRAEKLAAEGMANCVEPLPLHWGYLAGVKFFLADYEGALEAATLAGDFLCNNGAWRAASLVQLGRAKEAREEAARCQANIRRRWQGGEIKRDSEMTEWLLQLFPIRKTRDREILRRSLERAGFPMD
ncbi:MAG: hypothetical protein JJ959_12225 [Nisaea sp.]|uniref:BTAD domain-containing putative transcriptional regulator n=1 Tax=Nisaea sp. TaxID=2024842 RepID=UPI001B03DE15|nr:BTAD domain-containing putative transcriptional regulator [Nisaea sp.]MBO6561300.1 hypothetical protein [Nisaea sp.]